jgi:asparagine synthase (glutamine-hydrolysing)
LSGIFGLYFRDLSSISPAIKKTMSHAMAVWGRDGIGSWQEDEFFFLGQANSDSNTEVNIYNHDPFLDRGRGFVFSAVARLDNHEDLCKKLGFSNSNISQVSDSDLCRHAYGEWGDDCPAKIYGDWSFVAWHPAERKLFLARDHFGNTALYYHIDQHFFAFASSRQALLDLKLSPIEMDELYLAQVLISWSAYNGERTIHKPIRRLPPAHTLTVTQDKFVTKQYWFLEETPLLYLPNREDYVAAFHEVFNDAVKTRLLTSANSDISVSLSGGLDSGAVAVTAAQLLRSEGRRLKAFTSVPLSKTSSFLSNYYLGDEFPLAAATANFAGNIDLFPVNAVAITPIQAIRRMLQILNEPAHAAGNFFWLLQLRRDVAKHGGKVLLTGQMGNGSISWNGDICSQPVAFQLKQLGMRRWLKNRIKRVLPPKILSGLALRRHARSDWYRSTAIHPDFADRLHLLEQRYKDPDQQQSLCRTLRRLVIQPGQSNHGSLHAEMLAAEGIEVRDPTADARLLAFTFSIPDHIYMDPKTGQDRWLIREAMRGRLPEEVRLNRSFGFQAADRVLRLRASAKEVDAALSELSCGPASSYVDVAYMRRVWHMVLTEDTPDALSKSATVLLRGIMAGLFVNSFYE